jgi:hypothetical protein
MCEKIEVIDALESRFFNLSCLPFHYVNFFPLSIILTGSDHILAFHFKRLFFTSKGYHTTVSNERAQRHCES